MAKKAAEAPKESKCPITRSQFAKAAPTTVRIGETGLMVASPREFSTGSLGWFANEKIVVTIDGVPTKVQAQITLTVVGSKDLPK